jgi:hypothetical protein
MASYTLTIDGTDRADDVKNASIKITDVIGSGASTMIFTIENHNSSTVPGLDDEVMLTQSGSRLFGGRILRVNPRQLGSMLVWDINCVDYTRDLDRNLVVEGYQDMTDKAIIEDIIDNYCGGTGITYDSVVEGITISSIAFSYMPPSECFSKICKLTGREWYIDYDKDVHYQVKTSEHAPFNIS